MTDFQSPRVDFLHLMLNAVETRTETRDLEVDVSRDSSHVDVDAASRDVTPGEAGPEAEGGAVRVTRGVMTVGVSGTSSGSAREPHTHAHTHTHTHTPVVVCE